MCYLLLYRIRLQDLAIHLKDSGRSSKAASGRKGTSSGPQLALVIHLLAVVAFVVLVWTIVTLVLDFFS
jgi:hypothetical protein